MLNFHFVENWFYTHTSLMSTRKIRWRHLTLQIYIPWYPFLVAHLKWIPRLPASFNALSKSLERELGTDSRQTKNKKNADFTFIQENTIFLGTALCWNVILLNLNNWTTWNRDTRFRHFNNFLNNFIQMFSFIYSCGRAFFSIVISNSHDLSRTSVPVALDSGRLSLSF